MLKSSLLTYLEENYPDLIGCGRENFNKALLFTYNDLVVNKFDCADSLTTIPESYELATPDDIEFNAVVELKYIIDAYFKGPSIQSLDGSVYSFRTDVGTVKVDINYFNPRYNTIIDAVCGSQVVSGNYYDLQEYLVIENEGQVAAVIPNILRSRV